MAIDTEFHPVTNRLTVAQALSLADVKLVGGTADLVITHANLPKDATKGAVILAGNADYLAQASSVKDCVIITTKDLAANCPDQNVVLIAKNPRLAFAKILQALYATSHASSVSDTAIIDESAVIEEGAVIGAYAVIGAHVRIGKGAVIGAHAVINDHCVIGADSEIGNHCAISYCKIGQACSIGAHAVIGAQGFGFEMTKEGAMRLPHLGLVIIGDDVDVGAHCAIDRGVLDNTILSDHVMIDNQVHIAHNVMIGSHSIILAQVGIAGSAEIGKNVIIAGQAGVKDHVRITDNCVILSASKVTKNIEKAGVYGGYPAIEAKQHWKELAALRRLASNKSSNKT